MQELDFYLFCCVPAMIAVCAFTLGYLTGKRSPKPMDESYLVAALRCELKRTKLHLDRLSGELGKRL
jgi:hypothetical protein